MIKTHYDVIVVGGGHAGSEAAAASARMGVETLLLTHSLDTLGQLSCNPAIGGVGKGHIVKEISALGGVMAQAADMSGIHWRTLNASKGAAVQATRAQADRQLYRQTLRRLLEDTPHLYLFQQGVRDLILENGEVRGVVTDTGHQFFAHRVVITTGTFLSGTIHVGLESMSGGRAGDPSAEKLSAFLRSATNIRYGRLKTGTPPRLSARSIDYTGMQPQPSEERCTPFSVYGSALIRPEQRSCFITHTNPKTHAIIARYLDHSPMFSGKIEGVGPRYCPSIEDKIHRFASQSAHQVFIEPEGLLVDEVYPNGISTSLPLEAQIALIHSIAGLEKAHITRPGYAIEYDFFNPQGLYPWLESKHVKGLYFAGQINGTTGYEEAGGQGLLAGVNAALAVKAAAPWYPSRDEAYLGVLVDDLINQGTDEPYRMFTSRAEHRLLLREDNAMWRLGAKALEFGLLTEKQAKHYKQTLACEKAVQEMLARIQVRPGSKAHQTLVALVEGEIPEAQTLESLCTRQGIHATLLLELFPELAHKEVLAKVLVDYKYAGYIARQQREVSGSLRDEKTIIPLDFDYQQVRGLSSECQEKLSSHRPHTLGQASRLSGITPAAISLLRVALKRHRQTLTAPPLTSPTR